MAEIAHSTVTTPVIARNGFDVTVGLDPGVGLAGGSVGAALTALVVGAGSTARSR